MSHEPPFHQDPEILVEAERARPWSRPARVTAALLWAGFLGAIVSLAALLIFWQQLPLLDTGLSFAELTLFFVAAWIIGLVPASVAWLLSQPS